MIQMIGDQDNQDDRDDWNHFGDRHDDGGD